MTVCLALKYDKGILMLADTEEIETHSATRLNHTNKIFGPENLKYATAGNSGEGQLLTKKLNELEDVLLCMTEDLKNKKNNTLEKILKKMKGERLVALNATKSDIEVSFKDPRIRYQDHSMEFYSNGTGLEFSVTSYAEIIRTMMKEEKLEHSEIIIAGVDNKGKWIYEANSDYSLASQEKYAALGIGRDCALTLLNSLYRENLNEAEALLLATYAGVKCSESLLGINNKFNAVSIKENKGKIIKRDITENEISYFTSLAGTLKPMFPYKKLKGYEFKK